MRDVELNVGVRRMVVSTYQVASGGGLAMMRELEGQVDDHVAGRPYRAEVLDRPYLFNVFSHDSPIGADGHNTEETKLRRETGPPTIDLEPTPDVLAGVRERNQARILIGFAAETGSLDEAAGKAKRKAVDLLVANDVARTGSGFGSDTNEVTLIARDGSVRALPLLPKDEVAGEVLDAIAALDS